LSEGNTSQQPCAYLDDRLLLRVENPTGPSGKHGPVVFEQKIARGLAQRIFATALAALRSFGTTPGQAVLDGALFSVELASTGNTAKVEFGAASILNMSPEVRELNGLLHETAHAF
jgi:hypothetical protein